MKSIVYRGAYAVAVEDRPEPTIEGPLDAIVRITTTNICGSDLYAPSASAAPGRATAGQRAARWAAATVNVS